MNKTIKGGGLKSHLVNQRRRIEIAPGQSKAAD
jgi:hypothetical protein